MKKRLGLYTTIAISGIALFGTVIAAGNLDNALLFGKVRADDSFVLSLDTTNRITTNVSSATTIPHYTQKNNEINFSYSNCDANASYHAVIKSGGVIVNTTALSGITQINPVFTTSNGQLQMRASYDTVNWGSYVTLKSNTPYLFTENNLPYYVELSATGGPVSLTSVNYLYDCTQTVYGNEYVKLTSSLSDYSGTYLIVDEPSKSALKGTDGTPNAFNVAIKAGRILKTSNTETNELTVTKTGSKYFIQNKSEQYLDWGSHLYWDYEYSSSITFADGLFKIQNSSYNFYYDNGTFVYTSSTPTSPQRWISLYKATSGGQVTGKPYYDTGISCTDLNANNYGIGDTFATYLGGQGLNVYVLTSDGGSTLLEINQFSYVIKDGNNVISSTQPFESAGTYTVYVTYNDFFTTSYTITVNEQSTISTDYELVTSENQLKAGNSVIIVGEKSGSYYAMSTNQKSDNRGSTSITMTNNVPNINDDVCEFELKAGNKANTFAFYDTARSGYLYAASSGSNYLRTQSTLDNNGSFAISINSSNEASVVAQGTNTRNSLRFNSSNATNLLFSCYSSGQSPVYLYTKGSSTPKVLVQSVAFNTDSVSIADGEEYTLETTILPVNASNKELSWSSDDSSIASVNTNGKITANGVGSTIIRATTTDGSDITATCSVTVTSIAVTGVTLNENQLNLYVGDSSTLIASVLPSNASEKGVTWTSSNTAVATVSSSGVVTAIKAGSSTITVDTNDGHKQATCAVTVSNVTVTGFDITESELEMYVGDSDITLTTVITPNNATDKTVTWSSSNTSVATVSGGVVHAIAEGTTTITGVCNGLSDSVSVEVRPADEKPVISYVDGEFLTGTNNFSCTVNGTDGVKVGTSSSGGTFKVSIPANTIKLTVYAAAWNGVSGLSLNISSDQTGVTYSPAALALTSDSGVSGNSPYTLSGEESNYLFEISLSGVSTQTILTFTTSVAKRAVMWNPVCEVRTSGSSTVSVASVNVTPSTKTLDVGETVQLSAEVLPVDATNKAVTWTSNNTSKATVSASGLVTAVAYGTATITATTADGGFTDTCVVTVESSVVSVTGVTLSVSSKTLTVDESFVLTATVAPANATNKSVTWTSSSTSVATVDNGTVTAVSAGSATITVKTVDGNKTATCAVTVQASGGGGGGSSGSQGYVTDSLAAGQQVILTCKDAGMEMTSISTTSTRYGVGSSYSTTPNLTYKLTVEAGSSSGTWSFKNSSGSYLYWTSGNSLNVNGTKNSNTSWSVSFDSSGNATITNAQDSSRQILWNVGSPRFAAYSGQTIGSSYYAVQLYRINTTPTNPTSLSIPSTATLSPGKTTTLDVTYDAAANQNMEANWYSSNTSVATINKTTGLITAVAVGTTNITAKLRINESIVSNACVLTVQEQAGDKWTIMIYMCGSNLESDYSSATDDIKEILATSGQPDDINIIIETGGSPSWHLGSSYISGASSVPSNQLGRWHVRNNLLVKDAFISNADMAKESTYKSFLHWGLTEYPADKVGVILWDHGGGVDGCCFDDNYNSGGLLSSETTSAHSAEIGSGKLEFIGYDACLMQNMEVADYNAPYFNYQVASQESENGDGWTYTDWVDNLYANNSTKNILQEICDKFIEKEGSNQTLSYLDLSYASSFKTAFESYASALKSKFQSNSISGRTFATWAKTNIKNFGDEGYLGYGQLDVNNLMSKCQGQTNYKVDASYVTAVTNVLSSYVVYNRKGKSAGNAFGLSCTYRLNNDVEYTSSLTQFTNWLSFNNSYHY